LYSLVKEAGPGVIVIFSRSNIYYLYISDMIYNINIFLMIVI